MHRYTINKAEIKVLLQNETYKDTEILLPPPENKDILPIGRAIIRMKNVSNYNKCSPTILYILNRH